MKFNRDFICRYEATVITSHLLLLFIKIFIILTSARCGTIIDIIIFFLKFSPLFLLVLKL